jgi:hypothetical protein
MLIGAMIEGAPNFFECQEGKNAQLLNPWCLLF